MPVKSSLEAHEETGECLLVQLCYPDVQREQQSLDLAPMQHGLSRETHGPKELLFFQLVGAIVEGNDWPRHAEKTSSFESVLQRSQSIMYAGMQLPQSRYLIMLLSAPNRPAMRDPAGQSIYLVLFEFGPETASEHSQPTEETS